MPPEDILDKHDNELPEGTKFSWKSTFGHEASKEYYLVQKHTEITGRLLRDSVSRVWDNMAKCCCTIPI